MVLHGSEGAWSGYSFLTAAILAAHGYLAVPFGYSVGGNLWNAGDILDVPPTVPPRRSRLFRRYRFPRRSASTACPAARGTPCSSRR